MSVACQERRKGLIRKGVQPNSRLIGVVTRKSRKTPNMHVGSPTMTSSVIWLVREPGTNSKKLFTYIKSKKCDGSGVSPLKRDGSYQAEMLNSQFADAFIKEDCNFIPQMGPSLSNTAPPLIIQEKGVKKLLDSQNPHKASGPDQITPRFLKEMAPSITPVLTLIFQASFDQGQVPENWKRANVTPLFKKGDKSKAANYRRVSLTSNCCKIMEHIVHSHLMNFLESNNIPSDYQHGFLKKRSCETQLLVTAHDLAAGLDRHQQIDVILLDFSKAFDKVPHQRLATKLHHYGIRDQNLSWIKSFIAYRSQQVVLDWKSSSPAPVTSGVPEGTVLGPLLFLIYINDLPSRATSSVRLFANDCLLYRVIKGHQDAERLQADLNQFQEWEKDWQMLFNPDKCEHIRITNKRNIIQTSYNIHGHTLKETTQAKYLGVTIDNKLSWNSHVNQMMKRANQTTAFLRRNLSRCSKDVKAQCYKSLVRPQLEYAATTWDPYTKTNSAKVEAVQRRAARFCFNDYRQTSSVSSMMQDLEWEQLQTRRQQNKTVMMYRIVNNLVEIPANQYLTPTGVSTRGHQQRFLPYYCSVNAYQGSFFPSAIRLWNALPVSTVSVQSMDDFKVLICADIPRP